MEEGYSDQRPATLTVAGEAGSRANVAGLADTVSADGSLAGDPGPAGKCIAVAEEEDAIAVSGLFSCNTGIIERRTFRRGGDSRSGAFAGEEDKNGISSIVSGNREIIEQKIFPGVEDNRSRALAGNGGGGTCLWKMIAGDGCGIIAAGGGEEEDDDEEDGICCSDHPYKRNPGGICAFCLQEKLGNLLSSSSSKFNATFPFSVAPYSPPRLSTARSGSNSSSSNGGSSRDPSEKRMRMPSILARRGGHHRLQRSRSSVISTRRFLVRGSFWSFLHVSRHSQPTTNTEKNDVAPIRPPMRREVCRSRSVGCGSRSFSGDIFEKISTGLGDCALRRVESQRDGGRRAAEAATADAAGERVRCGGRIFTSMSSSSSSSSSMSSIWIAPPFAAEERKKTTKSSLHGGGGRNWVWVALASPMRALSRNRTGAAAGKTKPDLTAVPSLLTAPS